MTPPNTGSTLARCRRICPLMLPHSRRGAEPRLSSVLTFGAIVRRPLPLREAAHLRSTAPAGQSGAIVHVQPLAEVARRAVGAPVVAQRSAARADRGPEHGAHRAHELRGLGARQR